jgi:WD40 repeat protein
VTEPNASGDPEERAAWRDYYLAGHDMVFTGPVSFNTYVQDSPPVPAGPPRLLWDHPEDYYEFLGLDRFIERTEIIAEIDKFIRDRPHGWVVIQGGAGVGKSALAAHLVAKNDWFYHYTYFSAAGARSPEKARRNLAAQLISVFGLDMKTPGYGRESEWGKPEFLATVLRDAAAKRDEQAPGRPLVLVIDTLAEIDPESDCETPLGLPVARALPRKVFVIVTRRPGPPLPVGEPALPVPISANALEMQKYLKELFDGPRADPALSAKLHSSTMTLDEFTEALVSKCAGVWVYLKYVLNDIRYENREVADVSSLPQELRTDYLERLRRQRDRADGKWKTLRLPALATMAALRRPVTEEKLAGLIGILDAADRKELSSWLDKDIRAYLHKKVPEGEDDLDDDEPRYEIWHQSLRDLVAAPTTPGRPRDVDDALLRELPRALRRAHAAITTDLIPRDGDWPAADDYVRSTLAHHAAGAGRLGELVVDPGFLLVCQPSSVLDQRRHLSATDTDALRAVSAYAAALNDWAGLPPDPAERAWRLHVWASKTGAAGLAFACRAIAGRSPVIQAAMWSGTMHRATPALDGSVTAIAVLPMGDERPLLVSGGTDGLVRRWDPDAAAAVGEPLAGHEEWVTAAAAAPGPGGPLLATGAKDGTVWFWSPRDTRPYAAPAPGHRDAVTAITPVRVADDSVLATVGRDGAIGIWDPATRRRQGDPLRTGTGPITAATTVPVPAGRLLAIGTEDGKIQIWDLHDRRLIAELVTGHRAPVEVIAAICRETECQEAHRVAFATGGSDGVRLSFWSPLTRKFAEAPVNCHGKPVRAITVARLPGQDWFAAAGQGGAIRLLDAGTGATVLSLDVRAHYVDAIAAVPLPEAGILLATGGSSRQIELQELYESTASLPATTPTAGHSGHNGQVTALAVITLAEQEQPVLVSGSRDRTVRLWNPSNGEAMQVPLTGPMGPVRAVTALPFPDRGNLIATSDTDATIEVWDPAADPPGWWSVEHDAQVHAITAVRLPDPDRTLLAVGGDGIVRLWNPVTGEAASGPLPAHRGKRVNSIVSARLASSGRTVLVTGGGDGTVQFWDPVAGAASGDPLNWGVGRVRAVAPVPMPDGRVLFAAGGEQGVVQIWDEDAGKRGKLIGPTVAQRAAVNAITAIRLPARTLLATGSEDGLIRLWDLETGEPAERPLAGHSQPVRALAPIRLPGGSVLLASAGNDKTILIWTFG